MSGGSVKAPPRCSEKSPKELKAQEGIEQSAGLIRRSIATDRGPEQSPEGGARGSGTGGATRWQENPANDTRARLADEARRLGSGESP
jgi:hypothetical protein